MCPHAENTREPKAPKAGINEFTFHTTIIKTEYIFPRNSTTKESRVHLTDCQLIYCLSSTLLSKRCTHQAHQSPYQSKYAAHIHLCCIFILDYSNLTNPLLSYWTRNLKNYMQILLIKNMLLYFFFPTN